MIAVVMVLKWDNCCFHVTLASCDPEPGSGSDVDETIESARSFLPTFPRSTSLPRPDAKHADGTFVYARGAWESAVQQSARSAGHRGKKRKFQPMQWKELRRDFCLRLGCEQVPEVADPTKLFFFGTAATCVLLLQMRAVVVIASSCPLLPF